MSAHAQSQRLSVEDAARRLRYDFFHRASEPVSADRVAVGHTRDDQAETFLLKLIRGAGLTGLGGIYPRRDNVIRPLIEVGRAELRNISNHKETGLKTKPTRISGTRATESVTRSCRSWTSLATHPLPRPLHGRRLLSEKMVSGSMSSATGGSMPWLPGVTPGSKSTYQG